jgi:hypothetical protein
MSQEDGIYFGTVHLKLYDFLMLHKTITPDY